MARPRCVCGCGARGVHDHHVIYQQELRRAARRLGVPASRLLRDPRGLVPMAVACHAAHHDRSRPLPLHRLPDEVFEFAREVLGAGPAQVYLARRYAGGDGRLDALGE